MGIWYSAIGYFTIISPLINYGLGQIQGRLTSWRYMYIVAGIITTLGALVILFFLPPDPTRAKGMTERERYIAVRSSHLSMNFFPNIEQVARLRTNNTSVRNKYFKWDQVRELVLDLKFWTLLFATFFCL